jgi:hypothetical protein
MICRGQSAYAPGARGSGPGRRCHRCNESAREYEKVYSSCSIETKGRKQERLPDPRFPHAGEPWREEEGTMLLDALESVPDEAVGVHLFWLAEKLGRTPYSVACKIAALRDIPNEWKDQYRKVSDDIRKSGLSISDYVQHNGFN